MYVDRHALATELATAGKTVAELQAMVLQKSRDLVAREREVTNVLRDARPAEALEADLRRAEDRCLAAELKGAHPHTSRWV